MVHSKTAKLAFVPPQDESLAYRLVGFFEYRQALSRLDHFVANATRKELEIADQIVREQPQFIIYSNLASRIEKPGPLSEGTSKEVKQHGLAWMMALARVELSAMLAGFTSNPNPFGALRPTKIERDAYRELVTDGLRTHYWALRNDSAVIKYWQSGRMSRKYAGLTPTGLIAYIRRTAVALHFLNTAKTVLPASSSQEFELANWQEELSSFQNRLIYCLSQHVGYEVVAERTNVAASINCGPLLSSARRVAYSWNRQNQLLRTTNKVIQKLENPYIKRDPRLIDFDCSTPARYDDYPRTFQSSK